MDTKDEILKVVDSLFAEKGYILSMSEIAKGVAIKVPSIYSHFSGKDEIILLVTEKEIIHFFSEIAKEINKGRMKNSEEQMKGLFYFIIHYYKSSNRLRFWRNISLIQNQELKKKCSSLIRQKERELYDKISSVFKEGQSRKIIKEAEIDGLVSLYFVVIKGIMDVMIVYQEVDFDLENFVNGIWKEYWNSIKYQ